MNTKAKLSAISLSALGEGNRFRISLSILFRILILLNLILLASGCKPSPTPTPTPTPTTKPLYLPTATATSVIPDSGLPVVDDGSPLPPQVVEQFPMKGQELPLGGEIVLTFNQAMDVSKTSGGWRMTDLEGGVITGQITWPNTHTLKFKPTRALKLDTVYRAILGKEATTAQGVTLDEPLELQFSTGAALQVSQTFPLDGTIDVTNDAVITAIFNRPVVPLVIAEEQDKLPSPFEITPPISGSGEWINTSVYAFRPNQPLKGGTIYTITIEAGLTDAAGETHLAQDYSWSFTTIAPSIQSFELSSGELNPFDGLEDVLLDESFIINFNQPMNTSSTRATLTLTVVTGAAVPFKTQWNEDNTRITITPLSKLALDTSYTLNLAAAAKATDGGSLSQGLTWNFTTIPAPAVLSISPPEGYRSEGFNSELYIQFASPMKIDSVKEKIIITPQPEGEIEWWYNEYDWSIRAFILQPSTFYEVRTLAGMLDIYGNPTTQERVVRFTTDAAYPQAGLQMPYHPAILRVGGPQEFYVTYRNVKYVDVKLFTITPDQFISFLDWSQDRYQYTPSDTDLVWQTRQENAGKLNERVLKPLEPTMENGDPLSPGFYFLALDTPDIEHLYQPYLDTRLLVVADANLTFKTTTNEALMWVTDLQSGKPLSDVPLSVYDNHFSQVGQGVSDANGLLILEVPTPSDPYDPRYVMTDAGQYFAFASSSWGSGVNMYDYGLWSNYYAPGNQPKVYVYTDRPIYRPDQPVYFKGILRLDDDLTYSQPSQRQVRVTIENYKETIYEQNLTLSSFGSFDGQLTLDPEAALGYYNINVFLPGQKESIGGVGFTVAEYRKPEFRVQVESSPSNVLAGFDFTVTVAAEYYSGGAVADAPVDWTLVAEPFTFIPADEYSNYSFSDDEWDSGYYWDYESPSAETIADGQGVTDANGNLVLTLPADLNEAKTSREFTFEATITDLSQNAVSGRTTIVAHRSAVYPGVRSEAYIGRVNQEQTFQLVALDWDSKPIPAQKMEVEIVERRWYSVQVQDATGRVQWETSVEETPVASGEVTTDSRGKASFSFTPPKGGVYRAKVSSLDGQGNQGHASAYIWVAGEVYIPWRQTNDRNFDLITDRNSYAPGDTAEILIASPFQGDCYALVTVERGHIYRQEVLHLTSNSALYKLPITADLAPNVYISVVVVKGVDQSNPRPNFKMGITEINVDTRQQEVLVSITPDRPLASPGEKVTYTVAAHDAEGRPVDAELSLGLSDLATLSLASPNSPPILDFFYDERILGVWTSIPIGLCLEDYNAEISEYLDQGEGMGSGGAGKGVGEFGVIEVRQVFPDTAFWNAHLQTGSDGEAKVTITLPDNLTTWRMDARAVTTETKVGQAIHDLISTRPLLVRPQTPRFFVAGDQARLGAAVHNNTDQPMTIKVSLQAQGLDLISDAAQEVELPAKRQAYVAWDVLVDNDVSRVDLIFSAQGQAANGERYQDASRPPQGTLDNMGLPVYRYEAHETVGTSGQMTSGGTRIEAISLPSSLTASEGNLTIKLSPSLAAGMTDGLTYLTHFPHECVEQTISRFLPNVISTRALKSAGLSDPDLEANLEAQVSTALQRLVNWQNPDGGWGWWSSVNQNSDVQTTAYVVLGLLEAREAEYTVSEGMLNRGIAFLQSQIQPITQLRDPSFLNRQAFVLYVLAHAGWPNVSASVQLYDQRQNMAIYARAFLALTFHTIDDQDPRLRTLLSDFATEAITSASGSHWEEEEVDRFNWNTDTRTTAIVLSTLSLVDPNNPLNANAVRWLMSNRTDGHWNGTQETAWTLMALTNWMEASGELQANYQYAVAINGERLGGGIANAKTLRETLQLQVSVADMLKGEANRLAIARDEGTGILYYTAHLDVTLPVKDVSALDRGIIVSRSYYPLESSQTDLSKAESVTQAQQGDLLLVRLTLVAPNALHYVIVEDPLPAGLEVIDQSLEISPQNLQLPLTYNWDDVFHRGWGWWYFEYTENRDEKVVLSASYLPAGTYIYTYLARAGTAGTFNVIPPTAQEFYFPEVYGRGEGSQFIVIP